MDCPFLPEKNTKGLLGIALGIMTYYWVSTMSPLEWILLLRFMSLIFLLVAIYFYCKIQPVQILFLTEEDEYEIEIPELKEGKQTVVEKTISETFQEIMKNQEPISEKLQEVEEMVKTPTPPPSPKEDSAEFEDLVKPKKVSTKRRK